MKLSPFQKLSVGNLLCATAGGIDSYTYLLHGHVFAGLQTGNLILLGTEFDNLNGTKVVHYAFAIMAFLIGILITKSIQELYHHFGQPVIKIENLCLLYEIFWLLIAAGFSNYLPSLLVIGCLSLAAAAQLQEFRKVDHDSFTSLMMTGHFRKVIDFGYQGWFHNQAKPGRRSLRNLAMLGSFVIGAGITGFATNFLDNWALVVPLICLGTILALANY